MTFVRSRGRRAGVSRSWVGAVAVAAAAWVAAPSALAANAAELMVELDVKPVDAPAVGASAPTYSVSVSRSGLSSYASYKVKMTNGSTNTVNQVVFRGSTTVKTAAGAAAAAAPYAAFVDVGSASPNCTLPPAAPSASVTSTTCAVGQLKGGETREFFLIFQAPAAGASIEFSGDTNFSSGNSSNAPPAVYTQHVANSMVLTTVQTADVNSGVRTVLPPSGGAFFTGANGQVDATNLFSTSVSIPSTDGRPVVTDNRIAQRSAGASYACPPLVGYFCYGLSSQIDIRNAKDGSKVFFDSLGVDKIVTIVLRQDAASLTVKKPTPAPADVKLFYSANGGPALQIPLCSAPLVGAPAGVTRRPYADNPCISAQRSFLKGKRGYYEYEVLAVDNGVFSW